MTAELRTYVVSISYYEVRDLRHTIELFFHTQLLCNQLITPRFHEGYNIKLLTSSFDPEKASFLLQFTET